MQSLLNLAQIVSGFWCADQKLLQVCGFPTRNPTTNLTTNLLWSGLWWGFWSSFWSDNQELDQNFWVCCQVCGFVVRFVVRFVVSEQVSGLRNARTRNFLCLENHKLRGFVVKFVVLCTLWLDLCYFVLCRVYFVLDFVVCRSRKSTTNPEGVRVRRIAREHKVDHKLQSESTNSSTN